MLNGLGKGVTRGRLTRDKALLFWQEVQALPVRVADVAVNETAQRPSRRFGPGSFQTRS